jgi:hypothetical protein
VGSRDDEMKGLRFDVWCGVVWCGADDDADNDDDDLMW